MLIRDASGRLKAPSPLRSAGALQKERDCVLVAVRKYHQSQHARIFNILRIHRKLPLHFHLLRLICDTAALRSHRHRLHGLRRSAGLRP
ncbi:MAG TPA: hypothetical protein DCE44_01675, partial [Verrucomicrobiales bacterium]|nr:hypothetical protein [Verrucomicrobiales bacterium]